MPHTNNRSKKTKKTDRRPIPIWVLWLAAGLFLAIVAAGGFVLLQRQQNAVFLDVRPANAFRGYHITNSKSIPLSNLPSRLKELPRHTTIVVVDDNFDLSPKVRDLLL